MFFFSKLKCFITKCTIFQKLLFINFIYFHYFFYKKCNAISLIFCQVSFCQNVKSVPMWRLFVDTENDDYLYLFSFMYYHLL